MAGVRVKITKAAIANIHGAVDELFDTAKAYLLGPQHTDKRIEFNFSLSLPGLLEAAAAEEYGEPDEDAQRLLMEGINRYIDSYREATKAQVVKAVDSTLQRALAGNIKTDFETVLNGELSRVWGQATRNMKRLIDTEATNIRNTGTLDGVVKVNLSHGIEDPVIYFVVVRDAFLCDECKRLHLLEDGKTPRLWYLSEIGHQYHKKGEPNPKVSGLHPNCRCSLVTLMPGYGFNDAGAVTFRAIDHQEILNQRQSLKSEPYVHNCTCQTLAKSTRAGLKTIKTPSLQTRLAENGILARDKFNRHQQVNPHDYDARNTAIFKRAPIIVALPRHILTEKVAETGRLRNAWEKDTKAAGGSMRSVDERKMYMDTRNDKENELFEIPREAKFGLRPVYGSLWLNYRGSNHNDTGFRGYGDTFLQLKSHVKKRSTCTYTDSFMCRPSELLSHDDSWTLARHPSLHPFFRADDFRGIHRDQLDFDHLTTEELEAVEERYYSYIEAQIHGGVYLHKDVDSIHLPMHFRGSESDVNAIIDVGRRYKIPVYQHFAPNYYIGEGHRPAREVKIYDPESDSDKSTV